MNELFTKKAIELVIMDAIERGHTNKDDLIKYMDSDVFKDGVANYASMLEQRFSLAA